MKRARWFNAEWPASIRTLANRVKAAPFTKTGFDGFVLDRVREDELEARYVEKLLIKEVVVDPFGNQDTFERLSYRQTAFAAFSSFPNLQLIDAPRGTEAFTSKLLEISRFELTISPLSVDPIVWANALEREIGRGVYVDSLQVAGLQVEKGVTAKINLRGDRDVRDVLATIVKGRPYSLETVQLRGRLEGRQFGMVITKNGGAIMPDELQSELLPVLRMSLRRSVGKKN